MGVHGHQKTCIARAYVRRAIGSVSYMMLHLLCSFHCFCTCWTIPMFTICCCPPFIDTFCKWYGCNGFSLFTITFKCTLIFLKKIEQKVHTWRHIIGHDTKSKRETRRNELNSTQLTYKIYTHHIAQHMQHNMTRPPFDPLHLHPVVVPVVLVMIHYF